LEPLESAVTEVGTKAEAWVGKDEVRAGVSGDTRRPLLPGGDEGVGVDLEPEDPVGIVLELEDGAGLPLAAGLVAGRVEVGDGLVVQTAADVTVALVALGRGQAVGGVLGGDGLPFDVEVEPLVVPEASRSRSYVALLSWT